MGELHCKRVKDAEVGCCGERTKDWGGDEPWGHSQVSVRVVMVANSFLNRSYCF